MLERSEVCSQFVVHVPISVADNLNSDSNVSKVLRNSLFNLSTDKKGRASTSEVALCQPRRESC